MNIPFFDLKRQHESVAAEFSEAIERVVKSGNFILGTEVQKFEESLARYLDVKYCITCGNGTDALELVMEALEIGDGHEVIVPAFGWVSPALAAKRSGARPVFVDVEYETGNMDVKKVVHAVSRRTKAVLPIHLFGNPCRILELKEVCRVYGLWLIEDCAQAHGAEAGGRKAGSIGDASVFSFYPTKNLGSIGDGGAVVTSDDHLAERLYALRDYGRTGRSTFKYPGRNSRLDELQAAVLNVKLKYLDTWNVKRKEIARCYWEALELRGDFPEQSVFYRFVVKVKERDRFRGLLREAGIGTDVHYPFHMGEARVLGDCPEHAQIQSGRLSGAVVSLPLFPELADQEISYICEKLKKLQNHIQYEI